MRYRIISDAQQIITLGTGGYEMEVLTVILASLFSAAVLFVIAKFIGHKQVAQLEFFDYITGISIGSIAAELAATLDKPWWKPTVSMIVFGFITETWLKKELKEQGYKNAKEIFLGICSEDNQLTLYPA